MSVIKHVSVWFVMATPIGSYFGCQELIYVLFMLKFDISIPGNWLSIINQTSTQLQPSATLLARPTFGGLWSQNCLKKEHVSWKDMIFWIICLEGGHAFLYEMSYGKSCIGGVHAFRMAYLTTC